MGNHTVNHKSMPSLTQEQINSEVMDLHKAIYSKFEYEVKYLRPPMGEYSQKTLAVTNSLGYTTVMWSFAYEDWNEKSQPDEEKSKQKILNTALSLGYERKYIKTIIEKIALLFWITEIEELEDISTE